MSLIEKIRQVNAKPPPEENVALRIVVLVAVLAAAMAVVTEGVGSGWLRLAVLGGIPVAFWFSWWARHREGFGVKLVLAVAVLIAFGRFLSTIGVVRSGNFADLQIPLAELFLWVQLLHAFDVPARRDLQFSLVSSFVLMGVAGVLSISMALVPYLVVWASAATASLVLSHRSELASLPALSEPASDGTPAGRPPRAGGIALQARRAAPIAVSFVLVVAVAGGAFFLAPPAGQARAITFPSRLASRVPLPDGGGLSNPSLGDADPAGGSGGGGGGGGTAKAGHSRGRRASFGYLGFSTSLDTSARGRPDGTLVMRVRANRADFWRGQTFDTWDGQTWHIADDRPVTIGDGSPISVEPRLGDPEPTGDGGELVQTYYVRQPGPNLIFAAATPTKLYFPDRSVFELPDGTLRAGVGIGADSAYTVISTRRAVTADALRAADLLADGTVRSSTVPPALRARYAARPVITDRVQQLAADITRDAPTTYDKVLALETWMAQNTTYSLDIPPLPEGADAVDQYLFVDRKGFCEQIGTSLVVMLRSLGVPARLVTGYAPGERNPFTGLYEVRASDAHAWAEVWFPGIGWQGFDPTAKVPFSGDPSTPSASTGIASYLSHRLPHIPGALVAAFVLLGLAITAAVGGRRGVRALRRFLSRPQPSWAETCLHRLERAGEARGRPRRESETVREYAAALRRGPIPDPRLDEVAAVVTRDAFGAAPADPGERGRVEQVLQEIT